MGVGSRFGADNGGDSPILWAVSEIIQVFDKELVHACQSLESIPCDQDQEDALVEEDDETENIVTQYRQVAQKMSDKIRMLLTCIQESADALLSNTRQAAESFAPLYLG